MNWLDTNWHNWSAKQGHETIDFGSREVKKGDHHTMPTASSLTYLVSNTFCSCNCKMFFKHLTLFKSFCFARRWHVGGLLESWCSAVCNAVWHDAVRRSELQNSSPTNYQRNHTTAGRSVRFALSFLWISVFCVKKTMPYEWVRGCNVALQACSQQSSMLADYVWVVLGFGIGVASGSER